MTSVEACVCMIYEVHSAKRRIPVEMLAKRLNKVAHNSAQCLHYQVTSQGF